MKCLLGIYAVIFFAASFQCVGQGSSTDSLARIYKERSRWEMDLNKIIDSAYRYYYHPRTLGGGEGSYIGFSIPETCVSTEFGTYSLFETLPNRLVIQANLYFNNFPLFCIVDSNGNCKTKTNGLDYILDKIGALAYQYRTRSIPDGGGGGSYVGFFIPPRYKHTSFGRFLIENAEPGRITIKAQGAGTRITRTATFLANGSKSRPGDYHNDIKRIESLASTYRHLPRSQGGGGGSYIGFRISEDLDSTSNGMYSLYDVQPDELVLKIRPRFRGITYLYVIDSTGRMKSQDFEQRGNLAEFRKNEQAIGADMKVIAQEAADYWKRSRPKAGMRGSFEQFTIPISMAFTINGNYSVVELREDTMYVEAISALGSGRKYYRIDYTGRLLGMIMGEYRPPISQLKNNAVADPLTMYKNADWKLNEVYRQLLAWKKNDSVFRKNLRNGERLWIQYRDAQFAEKYPKVKSTSDKSMLTKPQLLYLTILTEDRIKELQEMYDRQ